MATISLAFLAFFAAGLFLCAFRHPVWGLYTYILVFYLDAPNRWWGESIPQLRWSLIIAATTLLITIFVQLRKQDHRPSFLSHSPLSLFAAYVVLMLVQIAWAISSSHMDGVVYFVKYLLVLYLIYTLVDNKERLIGFLSCHVLGCFYLGIVALSSGSGGRLDGVGGAGIDDSNSLGMQMATGVLCAGGLYFMLKGKWRLFPVMALPFILNTIILSGSRGAFLAVAFGGLAIFLFRPPKKTGLLIGYGLIGVTLLGMVATEQFWDRMSTIKHAAVKSEQMDTSAGSRWVVIEDQWRIALDYPMGVGHKGTADLSYIYIDPRYHADTGGRSSHNTFMSALVDQGFIGFFLWFFIAYNLVRTLWMIKRRAKESNDEQIAWLSATIVGVLVAVWVGGLFAPFLKAEVYVWMIGLVCSLRVLVQEFPQQEKIQRQQLKLKN